MRYHGGKGRHARHVEAEVLKRKGTRTRYLEPFIGGGSVFSRVARHFPHAVAGDVLECLINLWVAKVYCNWEAPLTLSREEYQKLKDSEYPTPEKAWAGFAASYNGKWFSGYGPIANGLHKHDYLAEARRSLDKKASTMTGHQSMSFVCADYRELSHLVDETAVVYCDPPYEGTHGYDGAAPFDTDEFWDVMEQWKAAGALVFVHEFHAPDGWDVAYEKERVSTMDYGGMAYRRTEYLFVGEQ